MPIGQVHHNSDRRFFIASLRRLRTSNQRTFSTFEHTYSKQGLAVVGVSLDEDGWKAVTPFLKTADIPYRIVPGDDSTARKYSIGNMPDAFLIDRQGRIAATYAGLVDRGDVEANIRSPLSKH